LGISQRIIHTSRSHISINRHPRKAFPTAVNTPGDRIKVARIEQGLLQAELAQKLEVSTAMASRWERNVERPTEAQWERIASLLGLAAEPHSGNPTAE